MKTRKIIVLFLGLAFSMAVLKCSQLSNPDINDNQYSIFLTGRVLDKDGKPMPNSIARLLRRNISDTTDADGNYQIVEKNAISSLNKNLSADTLDSLQIIREGQVITILDISKWIDTLPDVFVIRRDIYGSLASKPDSLCVIKAIITGDNIPDSIPKIAELWYDSPNQSYGGFVYFVYTTQLLHYSVYVNFYNKDSSFVGRSARVDFPSNAGNINIPTFNPDNGQPIVDAGNDTTVGINDTIKLHATAVDSFGDKIAKWEWSINGGNFIQTSTGDTIIIAPADSNPAYRCIVRATDNDGQTAADSLNIIVCKDTSYSIFLAGRVLDKDGKPMPNTIAKLIGTNLSDTTDASGHYQIIKRTRTLSLHKNLATNALDSLQIIKEGQVITILDIAKWIDTLPDVFVIQRDIYGSFSSKPDSLCIIKAIITGATIPDSLPKTAELWYNSPNQSYSGFVYFVYTAQLLHYSVYVNVYNKDSSFVGRSAKVDFPSNAGNINIPTFNPDNGQPIVDAGNDTTVSINDTIKLHATAVDSFGGKIAKWEWSINGGNFVRASSGDTIIFAPADSNPAYKCIVRATDNDGQVSEDSLKIVICKDVPSANAGVDSTLHMNSQYVLHGRASQKFGRITKWEWNIGNTGFMATSSSDTTIMTPSSFNPSYSCVLRVTDEDGNTAVDTCFLYIGIWEPVGNKFFSSGGASNLSIFVWNGMPYLSCSDGSLSNKLTVMKFDGAQWIPVGSTGFSDGSFNWPALYISNGVPYVGGTDNANDSKVTVYKFNGSGWIPVGNKAFSSTVFSVTNATSLCVSNDTPFVAYGGKDTLDRMSTHIMKYDGNQWVYVGGKPFLQNIDVFKRCLDVSNGTPYVTGVVSTVLRYNASSWEDITGTPLGSNIGFIALQISSGIPYVGYLTGYSPAKMTVSKYNGSSWETLGQNDVAVNDGPHDVSFFVSDSTPYFAYSDSALNGKTTVMFCNNGKFFPVGKQGFSDGEAWYQSLFIWNKTLYVAYADQNNGQKATVMQLK